MFVSDVWRLLDRDASMESVVSEKGRVDTKMAMEKKVILPTTPSSPAVLPYQHRYVSYILTSCVYDFCPMKKIITLQVYGDDE